MNTNDIARRRAGERFLGIDVGAETIKIVELQVTPAGPQVLSRHLVDHLKDPAGALRSLVETLDIGGLAGVAATGRVSRVLDVPRVPTKAAAGAGVRVLLPESVPCTVVSIGSHGFYVLEMPDAETTTYQENSRCSQGTGNFLRQLVERFDLSVEEATELVADVEKPAPLSGRCPVILKTDMTHLANKGEDRARILAGLYDAVCENVQVLVRPRFAPRSVMLVGGVAQAERIRRNFASFLARHEMLLLPESNGEVRFLEAAGAALLAAEEGLGKGISELRIRELTGGHFESLTGLRDSLDRVRRMPVQPFAVPQHPRTVVLGFDIGSTGSKALAVDAVSGSPLWQSYLDTLGDPVGAARTLAKRFLDENGDRLRPVAVGATGSGREIVGSLMATCFGPEPVFVMNEIAAHATGALSYDPEVDTIFEIGGQDAKYIRLDGGRIVEAAMNEACSAGTGSFIEEQGRKFAEVEDVVQMGQLALGAEGGISLGQHCSVFMAEVIDEAVAAGTPRTRILAGIYDSVIQNYLNRVKGNRTVGKRIFCQGMPFSSDALAAAVARQTGRTVVVPPNPGTVGALGIALLAREEMGEPAKLPVLDLRVFLESRVQSKDTFVCTSTKGCGGAGNRCRIDRLRVDVGGKEQRFVWGGSCSLYDRGTGRRKLPDRAPDPFRERAERFADVIAELPRRGGRPVVAMSGEFTLKGLLPFFATFVHGLGFDVDVSLDAEPGALKRGIEEARIPFCAPMQMYHGVVGDMLERKPDYMLLPRLRELPRHRDETFATTCPIVQASPDILRELLEAGDPAPALLDPVIDMGRGDLRSELFREAVAGLAQRLGATLRFEEAYAAGLRAQERFHQACRRIGTKALSFAAAHDVVPVVVLGRPYTIYNDVLNSNVPRLLREQGALAIPVDCFPVGPDIPSFEDLYWGYSQLNLRAAEQIRRTDGVYSIFCSNYSCGPDSFNLHFYAYVMENKPFAIIETDGHSGDAGTKTRIEAFLFCVDGDRKLTAEERAALDRTNLKAVEVDKGTFAQVRRHRETLLIPRMGQSAEILAAVFRGEGLLAEALPLPTHESLRMGRRHTSGKECVPMTITTGSLLERVEGEKDGDARFALFMPTANGPCRFGVYNLLHKIILEKSGWRDRVRVVSPSDRDYFEDTTRDLEVRALVGCAAGDVLLAAYHDVLAAEREPGIARAIYDRYFGELLKAIEHAPTGDVFGALSRLPRDMFGIRRLIQRAAADFKAAKDFSKDLPLVSIVGEIYVRLDPFANGFVIERLAERGVRSVLAPFSEWMEYTTFLHKQRVAEGRTMEGDDGIKATFTYALQMGVMDRLYGDMAAALDWGPRPNVEDAIDAAAPYIDHALLGEAVLTLGGPLHEHAHELIDGVVSVGPLECMPSKIAEAQFCRAAEEQGILSITLSLNGEPAAEELLDTFAFEVKQRYAHGRRAGGNGRARRSTPGPFMIAARRQAMLESLRMLTPFARRRSPFVTPPA